MLGRVLSQIFRFVFFILLQGLIFNQLNLFNGWVNPYIYIFAILMLPVETPRTAVLFIAFATGVLVDTFSSTLGMHTSACVFIGFIQPLVLRVLAPRDGYEFGQLPTVQEMGLSWYLAFAGIITVAHHLWLFYVEIFRFSNFFITLLQAISSAAATLIIMVIIQYLSFRPKSRRRS
ncbi:hypothetical protein ABHV44_07580 [Flavobacteriales bacterium DA487]